MRWPGKLLATVLLLLGAPAANASAAVISWSMPEPVAQGHALNAVACPSATLCVAVGDGGRAVTSADPAGGAGTWTSADVDGANRLITISCATTRFCVATDNHAQVVASSNPTGGAGAWKATPIDPGRWLNGISCPSAKLCVVVDRHGGVLSATNPTGGAHAWKRVQVARLALTGVSCPSVHLCVATENGQRVVVSTHPTGRAKAWHELTADPGFGNVLDGISCPSSRLCVAAAYDGTSSIDAGSSTNPTSNHPWRSEYLDDTAHVLPSSRVACASTSLCVVEDNGSSGANASVSTRPGAAKWSTDTPPGSDSSYFTGVACATGPLCVIVDDGGDVYVGS